MKWLAPSDPAEELGDPSRSIVASGVAGGPGKLGQLVGLVPNDWTHCRPHDCARGGSGGAFTVESSRFPLMSTSPSLRILSEFHGRSLTQVFGIAAEVITRADEVISSAGREERRGASPHLLAMQGAVDKRNPARGAKIVGHSAH